MFVSATPDVSMNRRSSRTTLKLWASALVGLLLLAASVGCYDSATGDANIGDPINFKLPAFPETGSNAVQLFTEMHYQPSYRSQEEPRRLPPEGSVPITGAEVVYTSLDDYNANPPKGGDSTLGQSLYNINCLVCHGAALDGNGPIMMGFNYNSALPADLRADGTRRSSDNDLYAYVSGGGRMGLALRFSGRATQSPMPEFRRLLTEQERWDIVSYLRVTIGQP
jgi:mono/diheme cytochrome c family protein